MNTKQPAYAGLIQAISRRITTNGLTHEQVATKAGMPTTRLTSILHGGGVLTVMELLGVARALGTMPGALAKEGEQP